MAKRGIFGGRRKTIFIIDKNCPNCHHDRAWNKPRGTFCSRCGFRIEE